MKPFIKKIAFFLLPLFGWLMLVVWVDPYNYLNRRNAFAASLKEEIAYKIHPTLYELIEYKHDKKHSIVLGDSRARLLRTALLKKYAGRDFSNLAYSGGSLKEMISTFWLVAGDSKLKEVYMGVNFNMYNELYAHGDRVEEARKIMKNMASYALSTYTIKSTFLILYSWISGKKVEIGVPNLSEEAFWNYQLNVTAKVHYQKYAYPTHVYSELKTISNYCLKRGIRLVFFIPPTHVDLQQQIGKYHLKAYESRFKKDLAALGDVVDFDYPSPLTKDRANFKDPFHLNDQANEVFAAKLFSTKERTTKNLPSVFNQ